METKEVPAVSVRHAFGDAVLIRLKHCTEVLIVSRQEAEEISRQLVVLLSK